MFEAPGVEPVFAEQGQAINYAQSRASFRSGEIRIFDDAGNVIETHEHTGNLTVVLHVLHELHSLARFQKATPSRDLCTAAVLVKISFH